MLAAASALHLVLLLLVAGWASATVPSGDGSAFLQSREFLDEFGFVEIGEHGGGGDNGNSVVFVNLLDVTVAMFWDDGTPQGRPQGYIPAQSTTNSGTYPGHVFWFKKAPKPGKNPGSVRGPKLVTHLITAEQDFYLIHDGQPSTLESANGKFRLRQEAFMKAYRARTGLSWLTDYSEDDGPRGKPRSSFWPTDHVNQRHQVRWGDVDDSSWLWGSPVGGTIDMVVLSVAPKVFLLPDLLTPDECTLIKEMATPKLARSTIGAGSVAHEVAATLCT